MNYVVLHFSLILLQFEKEFIVNDSAVNFLNNKTLSVSRNYCNHFIVAIIISILGKGRFSIFLKK